jgi:HEAT repeat protein
VVVILHLNYLRSETAVSAPSSSLTEQLPNQSVGYPSDEIAPSISVRNNPVPAIQHGTVQGSDMAPAALLAAMKDRTQSPLYRQEATIQLIHKGIPSVVANLIQMAGDQTEDLYWRNFCVQLLRIAVDTKRDDAAVAALFTLSGNPESELSATAIWNLAVLVAPDAGKTRLKDDEMQQARQLALSALHDEKKRARMLQAGIQSCGRLGLRDALPDLRRVAADETDPALSQLALAALGELRDSDSRPLLESALTSPNPRRAQVARTALGMLK